MNEKDCRRNVVLYYVFALFNEPLFWGPILITSLQKLGGMSLSEIYYLESIALFFCAVLDIPSGALADTIGRKKTIVTGRLFLFGSVCFFATMTSPVGAWIGNMLWVVGFVLQSGADSALLYDTLDQNGQPDRYKKIEGRAIGGRLLLIALCSLASGFLANIHLRLPLLLCLPFVAVPLVASLFFKEAPRSKHYSVKEQIMTVGRGISFVAKSVEIRWMVGFAALVLAVSKVWFFTYNPYFETVGLDITYYGVIFFCLNIVAWLSSHYCQEIENRLGERNCVALMLLCLGVPILLMGLMPIWPFAYLVLAQNIVRGFMKPFVCTYLNRHANSDIRATVLSTQSTVSYIAGIVGLAVFGYLTSTAGLLTSLVILGLTTIVLGTISYLSYVKKIN